MFGNVKKRMVWDPGFHLGVQTRVNNPGVGPGFPFGGSDPGKKNPGVGPGYFLPRLNDNRHQGVVGRRMTHQPDVLILYSRTPSVFGTCTVDDTPQVTL